VVENTIKRELLFSVSELLVHPSRGEFSSLLVKNNQAEILVCQVSKEKIKREGKNKAVGLCYSRRMTHLTAHREKALRQR